MFTRIDHVTICVADLDTGIAQFKKLGFNMAAGGAHPGKGTHNAIAFNQEDYVELLAIRDEAEHRAASLKPGSKNSTLSEFIAAGGGIRYVVVQSDDLAADVAAMRKRGVDVSVILEERHAEIPLREIPPQDDIANSVVFFASPWSRVITGQTLDVNGGEYFG